MIGNGAAGAAGAAIGQTASLHRMSPLAGGMAPSNL